MISHKHKCIFIHISKCAGSSIETAFGIDITDNSEKNNPNLYGWNNQHQLFLNHATPQQLFDYGFLNDFVWQNYYKFIIIRNPWDRAFSDYNWLSKEQNIKDSFFNFINKKGKFHRVLTEKNSDFYRGDHLNKQIDYFFLNGVQIEYEKVITFENLSKELPSLASDLKLPPSFFDQRVNISVKKISHYSKFYNRKRRKLINKRFISDINFFGYQFEDERDFFDYFRSLRSSQSLIRD